MASRPAASSEVESSPSPLASSAANALAKPLDWALEPVELELTPSALSMSAKLTEPSLLLPIWLTRSLAKVVAAVSRIEPLVAEALEEALEDDEAVLESACADVRADKVSELKR
jgi:hypothetical protein